MAPLTRSAALFILVTVLFSGVARAHTARGDSATATVRAVRFDVAPSIDGTLTEEVWLRAPEIAAFTQREPNEGQPATEKTRVRFGYDDDALYVSAEMESAKVTPLLGRRDALLQSDWFRIYLDPHHDHRTGATFWVNPANVQRDAVLFDDGREDAEWDGVWSSAAEIGRGRWSLEMRIPFSQLRFSRTDMHLWGINIVRYIVVKNEEHRLVHVPKSESGFVSRFAHLTGIEAIRPRRAIELMPYAVARSDIRGSVEPADPLNDRREQAVEAGLDAKYGLTPNLTLTGTIRPDFGQVEVDPARVNLTQFELFFPEKRPFFVEGASLFNFGSGGSNWNTNFEVSPPMFFYSRRIGRAPQGTSRLRYRYSDAPAETDIIGAVKLTGKSANGWTIALLNALTAEERASYTLSAASGVASAIVEPVTNYFVARTAKDIATRGRVGMLFTSVNRRKSADLRFLRDAAYSGGVDGYWFFGKRDVVLEAFLGGSLIQGNSLAIAEAQNSSARYYGRPDAEHLRLDAGRTSLAGWAARAAVVKQTGRWRYNVAAQTNSPGFETNDAGFTPRSDNTAAHAGLGYVNPTVGKYVRERTFYFFRFQNWNTAGDLLADGYYSEGRVGLRNYWSAAYAIGAGAEALDDRATRGGPLVERPGYVFFSTRSGSDPRGPLSVGAGTFWLDSGRKGRQDFGADLTITYRPTANVSLRVAPSYFRSRAYAQYVRVVKDAHAAETYGARYVFGALDQRTFEAGLRLDWTFTSRLSLQLFMQPYVASGAYAAFKELVRPRTSEYLTYGIDHGTVAYDPVHRRYDVDPDGRGPAAPFAFGNPDFNIRSVRGSAVVRWEFRPGSAVYFAWNENRRDLTGSGSFDLGRDLSAIRDAPSDDVFMIKVSYWLPI